MTAAFIGRIFPPALPKRPAAGRTGPVPPSGQLIMSDGFSASSNCRPNASANILFYSAGSFFPAERLRAKNSCKIARQPSSMNPATTCGR